MEAGWLSALVLAPLFYNTYSNRIFEPDKAALIRSLALIVALAWLVKTGEGQAWKRPPLSIVRNWREWTIYKAPLFGPVAALVAVNVLATLTSVVPNASIWGSYNRGQGLFTLLAYLTFFAALAANLRQRQQVERLITVVILTSLPIGLYGLLQKSKLDPMPWSIATTDRIASTLGNAIFIAAYLILVVPLTILRLVTSARQIRIGFVQAPAPTAELTSPRQSWPVRAIRDSFVYLVILTIQLAAIYFSGSRGPWLGLLTGLFFAALLGTALLKRRALTIALLSMAGLGLGFIVTLNIPNGPLEALRETQYIGRLGHVLEVEDGSSKVRVLIWQGAAQMALPHEPLIYPDGHSDPLNLIRPLIGYGPESTYVAFHPFYAPEIAHYEKRDVTPDRSHNAAFDALITTGGLGLIAELALFAAIVYLSLRWLGLLTTRDLWPYLGFYLGGGLAGSVGLIVWRGPAYFGVGLAFGILIGLLIYLTYATLARQLPDTDRWRLSLLATLLGGLIGHFTEINFGIPIVSTQLYCWVFMGVLIVIGYYLHQDSHPRQAESAANRPRSPANGSLAQPATAWGNLAGAALLGLILITLTYDFIANPNADTSPIQIFIGAAMKVYGRADILSTGILSLFLIVWMTGSVLFSPTWRAWAITLGGSLVIWLGFTGLHTSLLAGIASQRLTGNPIENSMGLYINLLTAYSGYALLVIILMAGALVDGRPVSAASGLNRWVTAGLALGVTLVAALFTNLQPIQADMFHKISLSSSARHNFDDAVALERDAIGFAPYEDQYYLALARAQIAQSQTITTRTERLNKLKIATRVLLAAQRLNPLNPDHAANLAQVSRLSLPVAEAADVPTLLDDANTYYQQATRLAPNNIESWNAWARLNLLNRRKYGEALQQIQTSLAVDAEVADTYALLGDYWSVTGNQETNDTVQRSDYQKAALNYRQAIELDPQIDLSTRLSLGQVEAALKNYDQAIAIYNDILQRAPQANDVYVVYTLLAKAYLGKGDKVKALENAYLGYYAAPASKQDNAQALIDQIKSP
jgi:tetratricopeptide (TPR) repeat protein